MFNIWLEVPFWIGCNTDSDIQAPASSGFILQHISQMLVAPATELYAISGTHPAFSHLYDLVILTQFRMFPSFLSLLIDSVYPPTVS